MKNDGPGNMLMIGHVPLKNLDEFNAERLREYAELRKPRPNGIACPECGAELMDSRPNDPPTLSRFDRLPMRTVGCSACDYYGQRVA